MIFPETSGVAIVKLSLAKYLGLHMYGLARRKHITSSCESTVILNRFCKSVTNQAKYIVWPLVRSIFSRKPTNSLLRIPILQTFVRSRSAFVFLCLPTCLIMIHIPFCWNPTLWLLLDQALLSTKRQQYNIIDAHMHRKSYKDSTIALPYTTILNLFLNFVVLASGHPVIWLARTSRCSDAFVRDCRGGHELHCGCRGFHIAVLTTLMRDMEGSANGMLHICYA